jgi:hypothetical protein
LKGFTGELDRLSIRSNAVIEHFFAVLFISGAFGLVGVFLVGDGNEFGPIPTARVIRSHGAGDPGGWLYWQRDPRQATQD